MKFGTLFLVMVIVSSLLAPGCGGDGDPSKVSREAYKKIILDLSDSSKGPRTLEDILASHGVKIEDYGAAAREFAQDAAFMDEIKKITSDALKAPPASGDQGETPSPPDIEAAPPGEDSTEKPLDPGSAPAPVSPEGTK